MGRLPKTIARFLRNHRLSAARLLRVEAPRRVFGDT
jgi:hypothetical protein